MSVVPAYPHPRETNRLHRWAMWRMTVNEGIIGCIREGGTNRVVYPDNMTADSRSMDLDTSESPYFPFVTPEQMDFARKLNLREKYGTTQGLSEDTYFIFGLPRIKASKDVPEVTSTGNRSVYGSFSDFGLAMEQNNNNNNLLTTVTASNYMNSRRAGGGGGASNMTYSELGPTPDGHSLASHDDVEVQRINGYREEWRPPVPTPASPVPRLNLYSIQEEYNNNHNTDVVTDRYSTDRRHHASAFSSDRTAHTSAYPSDRTPHTTAYPPERMSHVSAYQPERMSHVSAYPPDRMQNFSSANSAGYEGRDPRLNDSSLSAFNVAEIIERFDRLNESSTTLNHPTREPSEPPYSSNRRYQNYPSPNYNTREVTDRYSHVRRDTSSAPSYNVRETTQSYTTTAQPQSTRETSQMYTTSQQNGGSSPYYNGEMGPGGRYTSSSQYRHTSLPRETTTDRYPSNDFRHTSTARYSREEIYPPFSPEREAARYSPRSTNYSPPPVSPRPREFSPLPPATTQSYSPPPVSPRQSRSPSPGPTRGVGSPGYGNKMRPTNMFSDGEAERLKRQAYYDWTSPTQEKYKPVYATRTIY